MTASQVRYYVWSDVVVELELGGQLASSQARDRKPVLACADMPLVALAHVGQKRLSADILRTFCGLARAQPRSVTIVPQPCTPRARPSSLSTWSAFCAVVLATPYSCDRRVIEGSASPGRNSPASIRARRSPAITR